MATEKRLIDANEQVDTIYKSDEMLHSDEWETVEIVDQIDRIPTVDAVEVVHGQWEEWWPGITLIMTGEEMLYRCSVCDAKYPDIEGYRYCPRCGADMRGDGDG